MLCGRRLWLSITTRHIAKSAKEEALVSRFGGAGPGLPRPRSPGIPPRISPEAAPLLCTRRPGVIDGRQRMSLRAGLANHRSFVVVPLRVMSGRPRGRTRRKNPAEAGLKFLHGSRDHN